MLEHLVGGQVGSGLSGNSGKQRGLSAWAGTQVEPTLSLGYRRRVDEQDARQL